MSKNIKDLLNNENDIDALLKKSFKQYDKNNNGKLEYSEIYNVMCSFCSSNSMVKPLESDVKKTFNALDLDKNGTIDYNEFKAGFLKFLKNNSK